MTKQVIRLIAALALSACSERVNVGKLEAEACPGGLCPALDIVDLPGVLSVAPGPNTAPFAFETTRPAECTLAGFAMSHAGPSQHTFDIWYDLAPGATFDYPIRRDRG